jgi:drug/metabolite transporter (DMT)-like permease
MVNQKLLGIFFGISAGGIWAVEAVLGKLLVESITFVQVAGVEVFFATLTALGYSLLKREEVKMSRKSWGHLILVGGIGTVFAPLIYFFGLTHTFAINASLIAHLQPLFVSIFGRYFLREKLHKEDVLASILIITAAVLITSRTFDNLIKFEIGNFGDLMVLLATVSWAIVAIPGKLLTQIASSGIIVRYRFLLASILFIPILILVNQFKITSIYQVLLGVLVGFGYILYYEGLKRLTTNQVALSELSSPFFAFILAWYFLGEIITVNQIIGVVLLFMGLYFLSR